MSNNLHSLSFCVLGGGSGEERGQIFFPSVYSTSRFPLPWASCDDGGGGASSPDNNTTRTGREGSRMVAATSGETKTAQTPKPKQEAFLPRGKKPKLNNNQPQHLPPPTQPRCVCGWQGSSPRLPPATVGRGGKMKGDAPNVRMLPPRGVDLDRRSVDSIPGFPTVGLTSRPHLPGVRRRHPCDVTISPRSRGWRTAAHPRPTTRLSPCVFTDVCLVLSVL